MRVFTIGLIKPVGKRMISGLSSGRANLKFSSRSVAMACISIMLWGNY